MKYIPIFLLFSQRVFSDVTHNILQCDNLSSTYKLTIARGSVDEIEANPGWNNIVSNAPGTIIKKG